MRNQRGGWAELCILQGEVMIPSASREGTATVPSLLGMLKANTGRVQHLVGAEVWILGSISFGCAGNFVGSHRGHIWPQKELHICMNHTKGLLMGPSPETFIFNKTQWKMFLLSSPP